MRGKDQHGVSCVGYGLGDLFPDTKGEPSHLSAGWEGGGGWECRKGGHAPPRLQLHSKNSLSGRMGSPLLWGRRGQVKVPLLCSVAVHGGLRANTADKKEKHPELAMKPTSSSKF